MSAGDGHNSGLSSRRAGPEIAAALEEHLRNCPDCTAFINTFKRTTQALQSICYEDVPVEMQSRVRQFLRAKIKRFLPDR